MAQDKICGRIPRIQYCIRTRGRIRIQKDDVSLFVWTFQIFMADATRVREQLREILWHKIRYVGGFREFNIALEQKRAYPNSKKKDDVSLFVWTFQIFFTIAQF